MKIDTIPLNTSSSDFVRWFRDSSPYIHAHRGRTFVVAFAGDAIADASFESHVHDFALLNSLGVRLVLVHGIRPQIEARLQKLNQPSRYQQGLRITDDSALMCVKEAAGMVRVELEALLSMGVANSPMAGAKIRVASGNFVVAKPIGVRDGVDFCHTGEVRRIDAESISEKLDRDNVVMLSPIGYAPTGEVFNLRAEEVATAAATALKADKLIFMMEQLSDQFTNEQPQITSSEVEQLLATTANLVDEVKHHLESAVAATLGGVDRVHLVNRKQDGALLLELFTRDGTGTLISATPYEQLRSATSLDISAIEALLAPLESEGVLVKRSRETLTATIDDFIVIERDGLIIGCAALHRFSDALCGELACVALHPDYRDGERGKRLLQASEQRALEAGMTTLFALSTHSSGWFLEQGFVKATVDDLPDERRAGYSEKRYSRVVVKTLSG